MRCEVSKGFEKKYISNASFVSLKIDESLLEEKYETEDSNIEGRDALMGTSGRGISLNMFFFVILLLFV